MENRRPTSALLMIYLFNMFYWMNIYTFVPVFPSYCASIVATGAMVGLVSGCYGLMQLIFRLPLGILSDKTRRRKPFIVGGVVCGLISVLGLYFFKSPLALLVFRSISGLAACVYVQLSVLYTGTAERLGRQANLGALTASSALGQVIGMLLGGLVGDAKGAPGAFLLGAGAGIVALCLSFFVKESSTSRGQPVTFAQLGVVVKSRALLHAAVLAVLSQAIVFGKSFTFSPIAAETFGASVFQTSIITALALVPQIILSPYVGRYLLPRFGIRAVAVAGFALIGLSCAMAAWGGGAAGLYASQVLTGVGNAAVFPSLMTHCIQGIEEEKRSTAMGVFQAVYGLGMFAGPWATGFVLDLYGVDISFLFNAIIAFVGAGLCLVLFRGRTPYTKTA